MAPRAALMKTGLRPLNTAHPKTTLHYARPMSSFSKSTQSTVKRPFQQRTVFTNKSFRQIVNIARPRPVNTVRPKPFNTARPNPALVNDVRVNQVNVVKASACWVWRPTKPNGASITLKRHNYIDVLEDQGYVDSRCSRHMTGNMSYLSDFKEFNRGYVTFGGGANGGRITGKGTIHTGNLDFKDVYFIKELKFNLFSVSQMCDKKNNVLFTDTEYGEQDKKAAVLYEYKTFKANEGELLLDTYVNDVMGSKKKTVVVTSDPLALIAEKTKVSKSKEKVVVSLDSKGSEADDFSELRKITDLLAKAFNRRKFYSKPTNNNLRTSSTSQSANKKQEFVKTDNKKVEKKDDEKRRDMSRVKCYNCKKEGHFVKDCKKVKVKDYEYYKTKMLLAKKDKDE
nr:ribonuclease H-like domain-containing protein [Tanacetum cinerariifolium]